MSGFIIAASEGLSDARSVNERYKRPIAAFRKKAMIHTNTTIANGAAIMLFANASHDPALAQATDNDGRTCTYVGTLFYKRRTGNSATSAILNDLRTGQLDLGSELSGNYCLIIKDGTTLRLIVDPAGLHHVFHNGDFSLVSNSFIATACGSTRQTLTDQEVLEYIFFGTTFGAATVVREVEFVPEGSEIRIEGDSRRCIRAETIWRESKPRLARSDLKDAVNSTIEVADEYYRRIAATFGSTVTASLSGGYDSRLSLALLRRNGVIPKLFVYGTPGDADVQIARLICDGEGLELVHVDRAATRALNPDEYWENQESVFHGLDGKTQYGFACDPWEISHRRERVEGGYLVVNGGGGEIWRDYWKLPDKAMSAEQFVYAYYGGRTGGLRQARCTERQFLEGLAGKVRAVVGDACAPMSESVVQSLYARFRVRFWQGANNSIDNHVGYAVTPFAETRFSVPAMRIPVMAKRDGWFERQLILQTSPELARYRSTYGYDFERGPNARSRVSARAKVLLPSWLRVFRRRMRVDRRRPYYHSVAYMVARFGKERLQVEDYVQLKKLQDPLAFSRALTIERLIRGQWLVSS